VSQAYKIQDKRFSADPYVPRSTLDKRSVLIPAQSGNALEVRFRSSKRMKLGRGATSEKGRQRQSALTSRFDCYTWGS